MSATNVIDTDFATIIWQRYAWTRDNGHSKYVAKHDKCDQFFRGDQWTSQDLALLKEQRRPALTINKIISTIGNIMGEQLHNRAEIAFRPRGEAPTQTAEVLTKLFKQISDTQQLDWKRSDMFADGIIGSRGYLDIRMDFSKNMQGNIEITNLNPKNVLVDHDAEDVDPDTWNEVFVTKWMTVDEISTLYGKEYADALRGRTESFYPYGYDSIDFDRDRFGDMYHVGYGGTRQTMNLNRNIRVIERQHRELFNQKHLVDPATGDMRPVPDTWSPQHVNAIAQAFGLKVTKKLVRRIRWSITADNVKLHDDWSPYKHFTVVPYFPFFRHGHTVGLVENLLDSQELLNKTSSQELHIVNTTANSGWKVKTGSLTTMSIEELEQRGAQSGLVIEYNNSADDIEKILPNSTPTGLDRISYKAEEHIKTISGVDDSQLGQDRADVAAKAIQAKRQAGSTNLAKPLDSLVRTDYMIARNMLDLIQEYYTEERIETITKDHLTGETEQLELNKVTPEGEIVNDLSVGDYDVVISSVPVRETLEDSQFDQAMMMKEKGIAIPDKFVIQSSRLLNKNDLIKQIEEQNSSPQAQKQAQLQQDQLAADVAKTQAETQQKTADAGLKHAKAAKEGVTAQKEAATPPEQPEAGPNPAVEAGKAEHEIDLKNAEFQHKKHLDLEKLKIDKDKADHEMRLKEEAHAQKMVSDRIARSKPQPTQTGA
jgi:hypothetical protein